MEEHVRRFNFKTYELNMSPQRLQTVSLVASQKPVPGASIIVPILHSGQCNFINQSERS